MNQNTKLYAVASVECQRYTAKKLHAGVVKMLAAHVSGVIQSSFTEITAEEFSKRMDSVRNRELLPFSPMAVRDLYCLDYFDNSTFKVSQGVMPQKRLSEKTAFKKANEILASESLLSELHRIYSPAHPQKFMRHPVHYKLTAANRATADTIVYRQLLCQRIYRGKRRRQK